MRCWPGCAPGGAVTFFLSRQKESNQRKRRPRWPCPLRFASGQPAMLGRGAALRNSLRSLRSLRSDNRSESEHEAWACCAAHARPTPCASRHGQKGVEAHTGPRCARPWLDQRRCFARRFLLPLPLPLPLPLGEGWGEGRPAQKKELPALVPQGLQAILRAGTFARVERLRGHKCPPYDGLARSPVLLPLRLGEGRGEGKPVQKS